MRVVILGAGLLGTNIAQTLIPGGHEITIVDINEDLIDRLGSRMDIQCINANAQNIESLRMAKVRKADVLIATTGSDDRNIALCAVAKEMGAKKCIARVREVDTFEDVDIIKRAMRIDSLLNPDYTCAKAIFRNLTKIDDIRQGYQMKNGVSLIEFSASDVPDLVGKELKYVGSKLEGLLIAAISRNGNVLVPNGDTKILDGDSIYAVGSRDSVHQMRQLTNRVKRESHLNRVMIAGGGKTAYFLAKNFVADGTEVKIIESDRNRAELLANTIDGISVVYGDATDAELLFEEELEQMDAFIAVTGREEGNIMLARYAKKHGVDNAIAKITNKGFGMMLDNIDDIMTISAVELCTADVINDIKEDNNIVFSKLIEGQAEFLEVVADSKTSITGKVLKDLAVPEGIIIAAIFRNGELIVPRGNTEIEGGDRVIILTLLSKIPQLQQLLNNSGDESLI